MKNEINSFQDLQSEIIRLETSLQEQERNLKLRFHEVLQRTKPLTFISDLFSGNFQSFYKNRWFGIVELSFSIYENYGRMKSEGSEKPFIDAVLEAFKTSHGDTKEKA